MKKKTEKKIKVNNVTKVVQVNEKNKRKSNHFNSTCDLIHIVEKEKIEKIEKRNLAQEKKENDSSFINKNKEKQEKVNFEETIMFLESSLPLFIAFDDEGNHFFPNIHYIEGKEKQLKKEQIQSQNLVYLLSKEQIKEEYIKELCCLIHPDIKELERVKILQNKRLNKLSAYAKKVFLQEGDLSEIAEIDEV